VHDLAWQSDVRSSLDTKLPCVSVFISAEFCYLKWWEWTSDLVVTGSQMALSWRLELANAADPLAPKAYQRSVNEDVIKIVAPTTFIATPPGNFCITAPRWITARTITTRSFIASKLQRCWHSCLHGAAFRLSGTQWQCLSPWCRLQEDAGLSRLSWEY
jgi:hypothetical protein